MYGPRAHDSSDRAAVLGQNLSTEALAAACAAAARAAPLPAAEHPGAARWYIRHMLAMSWLGLLSIKDQGPEVEPSGGKATGLILDMSSFGLISGLVHPDASIA